ncbi:PBAN-type neuropeptides-like [Agrilus planipennis]|uniref:PBAN-type neuropeptides-like n=1 Tax=Agrilus planipennis TaxID=224129 RepID=A0A7F5R7Z8_AGRPL|nr:PBAN-type neuropeptides-like [Agrilus planipennis]
MSPNSAVSCSSVLVVIIVLLVEITTYTCGDVDQMVDAKIPDDNYHQYQQGTKKNFALWFGPRLGRRKRNFEDEARVAEEFQEAMKLLKERPWIIIAIDKKVDDYTPRLGRESGEEKREELSTPPFAPRLGRRLLPFNPRLGRGNYLF